MTESTTERERPEVRYRVPISWEALEDAFENNAHEVHSYLHVETGEVIRVVDGVADPLMHQRIMQDPIYLRIDPVSSREQYRWMERFIATVDEGELRVKLTQSIDGKGAFRRFKDVLMGFPTDRERWFVFRSERLRSCMEGWLEAHGIEVTPREDWHVPTTDEVLPPTQPVEADGSRPPKPVVADIARRRLHALVDLVPAREVESAIAFLEFLRERRHTPRAGVRGRDAEGADDGSGATNGADAE